MFDKSLDRDACLKYLAYLLEVAQQQQNDSHVKSGKLFDESRLYNSSTNKPKAVAPADPDDGPDGSSIHNKCDGKDLKDKHPKGAESRTGSSRHREAGDNRGGHRSREKKEDPRKEKVAPPRQEQRRDGENTSRKRQSRNDMPQIGRAHV